MAEKWYVHKWSDPGASGLMVCKVCGASRFTDLKGWCKTPAMVDGWKRQPFCTGEKKK